VPPLVAVASTVKSRASAPLRITRAATRNTNNRTSAQRTTVNTRDAQAQRRTSSSECGRVEGDGHLHAVVAVVVIVSSQ
jgi:hypothetical protein